jgi:hypothetical protein
MVVVEVLVFMDKALMARRVQVMVAPAVGAQAVKVVAHAKALTVVVYMAAVLAQIKAPVEAQFALLAPVLHVNSLLPA